MMDLNTENHLDPSVIYIFMDVPNSHAFQTVHGHRRTAHGKEEVVDEVHLQIEPGSTRRDASGVRQRGKGKRYQERLSAEDWLKNEMWNAYWKTS